MLDNGADSYLLKNATSKDLLKTIENVASGKKFLTDEIKKTVYESGIDSTFNDTLCNLLLEIKNNDSQLFFIDSFRFSLTRITPLILKSALLLSKTSK